MNIVYEYPTGYGKSKLALDSAYTCKAKSIIIIVPRIPLINNWEKEIAKWNYDFETTYSTYASLHKAKLGLYDVAIFDECHHITERCYSLLTDNLSPNNILLSATIKKEVRERIYNLFTNIRWERKQLKTAIAENKLPTPRLIGYPIKLSTEIDTELIIGKKSAKPKPATFNNIRRLKAQYPNDTFVIKCSQEQYYKYKEQEIEYWKLRAYNSIWERNKYLQLCSQRLITLSDWKVKHSKKILDTELKDKRVIVFCNSIEQTHKFNITCIHSKNTEAPKALEDFNVKKINQIAAVNQLNEGINLTECQYGLFNSLNASSVMTIQKTGRILRHPHPIIIIPYFKGTREEELYNKLKETIIDEG